MPFEDNYQVTSKFSEHVHDFLSSHLIPPTPVNYSVVYLYISNENEMLSAAIDKQLQKGEVITADFLAELFSRYVSYSQEVESSVLQPFEETLTKALKKISQQVSNEDKATVNLEKLDKILAKTTSNSSLEGIVNYLVSTIDKTKSQHQALSKELNATQQEMKMLKGKLDSSRQEARVDALTGLLNRRGCDEELQALNLEDTHSSLAIDIDHFKKVNDNFGHLIGDKVIQRVAKAIESQITEDDIAVRFGGEEFVVIMVHKNINQARSIAEKIRKAVANLKLIQRESNTYLPPISVSIGIAQNTEATNWVSLFNQADQALYQAKNAGRNCCICA